MKTCAALIACVSLATGCAAFEEAYYVDHEFGQASQSSWDRQVVYPNYRHAGKVLEGFEVSETEAALRAYDHSPDKAAGKARESSSVPRD